MEYVVIGRLLGAVDYGVFSVVRSIVVVLLAVARGRLNLVITKESARYQYAHKEQTRITMIWQGIGSASSARPVALRAGVHA